MKKTIIILLTILLCNLSFTQNIYTLSVPIAYDSIFSLDANYYAVKHGDKWGVVKEQKQIIPCIYQGIDALGDGVISVIDNNKIGFIDTLGKLLIEPSYPIEKQTYREDKSQINIFDYGACLVEVEGEYRLIDKQNRQIISDEYEITSRIGDAVAIKKAGKYGIANSQGKILLYPQYLDITVLVESKLYAYKQITNTGIPMFGLIDGKGEILTSAIYADFGIYNGKENTYIKAYVEDGRQALLDEDGKIILPASYQVCLPSKLPNYFHISQNLEQGIIGRDSVIYVPTAYERVEIMITNDTFFLAHKQNQTYIYNTAQKHIATIEGNILDIVNINNNTYFLIENFFSYGVQNQEGKWIIEPIYDEVLSIISDNICFRKKDKWGVINLDKQIVIDFKYKEARLAPSKKFLVLYDGKKDSKLLNIKGEIHSFAPIKSVMIANNYIEYKEKKKRLRLYENGQYKPEHILNIKTTTNDMLSVKTKDGWTYTNTDYTPLTDQYFQAIGVFYKDMALVYKDNQLKIIDNKFQERAVLIADTIDNIDLQLTYIGLAAYTGAKYYIIKNKNKYGVINIKQ